MVRIVDVHLFHVIAAAIVQHYLCQTDGSKLIDYTRIDMKGGNKSIVMLENSRQQYVPCSSLSRC
eukprot:scaffold31278_cov27-Attheya_sp.AAC.2